MSAKAVQVRLHVDTTVFTNAIAEMKARVERGEISADKALGAAKAEMREIARDATRVEAINDDPEHDDA